MEFLINKEYILEKTLIGIIKDASKLKIAIQHIDYFYVQKMLGYKLHKFLMEFHNQDASTINPIILSSIQKQVYNLVRWYFATMVHHQIIISTIVKTNEKGTTQDTNTAHVENVVAQEKYLLSTAEALKSDLLKLIINNPIQFQDLWDYSEVQPRSSYYSPVINFKK